jgi:hypothetical protein
VVKERLFSLLKFRSQIKVAFPDLRMICFSWIFGCEFPLHAALYSATLFQKLFVIHSDKYCEQTASEFTNFAIRMVWHVSTKDAQSRSESGEITRPQAPSDYEPSYYDMKQESSLDVEVSHSSGPEEVKEEEEKIALLSKSGFQVVVGKISIPSGRSLSQDSSLAGVPLFEILFTTKDDSGAKVIDIALESSNVDFLGNSEIVRIVDQMWYDKSLTTAFSSKFLIRLCWDVKLFKQPAVQFFLRAFCLITFIIVFGLFLLNCSSSVSTDFTFLESLVYLGAFSFLNDIIIQILYVGRKYFNSFWSWLNLAIAFPFLVMFVFRLIGINNADSDYIETYQTIYLVAVSVAILALSWRFLYTFVLSEMFGPLVWVFTMVSGDIFNFMVIALIVQFGCSVGFYFMVKDLDIDGYGTWLYTFYTLFLAFLSDFSNSDFSSISTQFEQTLVCILYIFYVILMVIIMINLLVAMLNTTFSIINSDSLKQYRYLRCATVYDMYRTSPVLPPPYTFIAEFVCIPLEIFQWIQTGCSRACCYCFSSDQSSKKSENMMFCRQCFSSGNALERKLDFVPDSQFLKKSTPYTIYSCCSCADENALIPARIFSRVRISHIVFCLSISVPLIIVLAILAGVFVIFLALPLLLMIAINNCFMSSDKSIELLKKDRLEFISAHVVLFFNNVFEFLRLVVFFIIGFFVVLLYAILGALYFIIASMLRLCGWQGFVIGAQNQVPGAPDPEDVKESAIDYPEEVDSKESLPTAPKFLEEEDCLAKVDRRKDEMLKLEIETKRRSAFLHWVENQPSYLEPEFQDLANQIDDLLELLNLVQTTKAA